MGKRKSGAVKALTVELWKIDRVKPYPGNPRKITKEAVDKVVLSITKFGWRQPIVVDSKSEIIVGHTRLEAAKTLGLAEVPVHVADLNEDEVRAYRIADNRTGEEAVWDDDLLAEEINRLLEGSFDIDTLGFEETELSDLLEDEIAVIESDVEEAASGVSTIYLSIDEYKVAMSPDEKTRLRTHLDRYVEDRGLDYGFVNFVCEALDA